MAILNWSRELETGIRDIDLQHRHLVAIANHLHDALLSAQARQAIDWILEELALYALHHFDAEERLMQAHGYQDDDQHRREHAEMIKAVKRFRRRLADGDSKVERDVMAFLGGWLRQHIMGTDQDLGRRLQEKGVR